MHQHQLNYIFSTVLLFVSILQERHFANHFELADESIEKDSKMMSIGCKEFRRSLSKKSKESKYGWISKRRAQ